jgi:hypothetical protein
MRVNSGLLRRFAPRNDGEVTSDAVGIAGFRYAQSGFSGGLASALLFARRGAQQLPGGSIAAFDQGGELQLTNETFLGRMRPARDNQPVHFLLHCLTFLAPVLKHVRCHITPPVTQPTVQTSRMEAGGEVDTASRRSTTRILMRPFASPRYPIGKAVKALNMHGEIRAES